MIDDKPVGKIGKVIMSYRCEDTTPERVDSTLPHLVVWREWQVDNYKRKEFATIEREIQSDIISRAIRDEEHPT